MNPNPPQQSELTGRWRYSYEVGAAKAQLARVTDAFAEL